MSDFAKEYRAARRQQRKALAPGGPSRFWEPFFAWQMHCADSDVIGGSIVAVVVRETVTAIFDLAKEMTGDGKPVRHLPSRAGLTRAIEEALASDTSGGTGHA